MQQRHLNGWHRGVLIVPLFCCVMSSCSEGNSDTATSANGGTSNPTISGDTSNPPISIDQARSVLKTALDAWVFGDTAEQFRQAHPNIAFFDSEFTYSSVDVKYLGGPKLLKYDIGAGRPSTAEFPPGITGFDFAVVLSMVSNEGSQEVKKSRRYTVRKKDGQKNWSIWVDLK